MNKYAKLVVHVVRWAVCLCLIWKTVSMMFGPAPTFKTAEETQFYVIHGMLWMGSVMVWMLFTLYLFPDDTCKEDDFSRWLDAKIGRDWRRTS